VESEISEKRLLSMLGSALGAAAGAFLEDKQVIELMLNPDGKLWVDTLGKGRSFSGHSMSREDAERVIFIVASYSGDTCSKDTPIISSELPESGFRFQGVLPPLVKNPTFTIRKQAISVFSLNDYVADKILLASEAEFLKAAVKERKNILVVGGTGSGKTTLTNALLSEIAKTGDRLVILEDTVELQCTARDAVQLRTREGVASMQELLKATMRLRPDRIIIGEVRGREALDLLKAWNTGHPGGVATAHADSAEAIDIIVYIEKTPGGRKVKEIVEVGWESGGYAFKTP
jgi:type IV secretion system protein VirB11